MDPLEPRNHAVALLARALPYIGEDLSEVVLGFLLSNSTYRFPLRGWSQHNNIERFVIYVLEDIRDENPCSLKTDLEYLEELLDEKARKANGQGAVHDPAPPP